MWQLCSSIPSTLPDPKAVSLMTAKVSVAPLPQREKRPFGFRV